MNYKRLTITHKLNDEVYGTSTWIFHKEHPTKVELHNEMYKFNKSIYKHAINELEKMKIVLRKMGVKSIVASYEDYTKKIETYLKLFGFTTRGTVEHCGVVYTYAVLEV